MEFYFYGVVLGSFFFFVGKIEFFVKFTPIVYGLLFLYQIAPCLVGFRCPLAEIVELFWLLNLCSHEIDFFSLFFCNFLMVAFSSSDY